jgi:hypothetical protein
MIGDVSSRLDAAGARAASAIGTPRLEQTGEGTDFDADCFEIRQGMRKVSINYARAA